MITHAVWLIIAAAAFAFGMTIKSNQNSNSTSSGTITNTPNLASLPASKTDRTGIPSKGNKPQSIQINEAALSSRSPNQLIGDFLSSNDPLEQNFLFAQMLMGITAENASGMYESLKGKLSGRDGGRQMALLFQAWGRVDGEAAFKAAIAGNNNEEGGRGRGGPGGGFNAMSALSGWAAVDAAAAKETLSNIEDDRQKSFLTFGLISGLAKSDAKAATDFVIELAANREAEPQETEEGGRGPRDRNPFGGDLTQRYISQIASEQLKRGISTAVDWAEALPDGDLKSSAFDEVAEGYIRSDIDAAKEWVSNNADQEYAQRAVGEVAEQLTRDNPQDAADWASTLPADAQEGAYKEVMERWTRDDAEAASKHLATMEPSGARDSAVSSFATSLDREDPQSAATWAATIDNEETRTNTLTRVAQSWMRTDTDGAKAWLPTSGLSQEAQTQILESPSRGRGADFRERFQRQR